MAIPTDLDTFDIKLLDHGVAVIAFNRPKKYNALNPQVYDQWGRALEWARKSEDVRVVVLTGNGKYYSSGQELAIPSSDELEEAGGADNVFKKRSVFTMKVVRELVHFPKLIIAAINGPVIGFGVTSTALCDVVYSVPDATFNTPFMQLGFCAEACSSVVFPRVMGYSRANEMLLMGRKFTAEEMKEAGVVARIFPKETFMEEVLKLATASAKFPPNAMKETKALIRDPDFDFLDKVAEREMELLGKRMSSDESAQAIMEFMMAKHDRKQSKL
ncbi:ClpP/crotonase-like domain-containing protein [Gamsiella multidivaricata]|uniref:ClpP/crotonase-like domain-containing protein n=1 Tax=Gamsiella multidivaricata TaxID=101098 RepID=UPI002220D8AA|nr:ClpP/crotonase-like domain-containing protein [Gamsiella multidivaricata]KAG0358712.1 Enoyl-CoA delta isomerase 2, mitochondrial [Gamsiella multidivaricata]KAI7815964.1 ClpP/crotonase-like domain-containing protein [Gamsiella multidivaricata]